MFWNRKKSQPEEPLSFEDEVLSRLKSIDARTRKIEKTVNGINAFIWGVILTSIVGGVLNYLLAKSGF